MTRHHPRTRTRDAGLTLLELLVVITILVVLSVAVGTVAINYLGGSKVKAARLQLDQVAGALDLYRLDMGAYPSEADGLSALVEPPSGAEAWNGPYLRKRSALEDPWGTPLRYASPGGNGLPYLLVSLGADATEGGDDEAADIAWE